ncbi:MAG: hypothetical protein WC282_02040, partial [Bacilli bacterium]
SASAISFNTHAPFGDEVTNMKIFFGDILAYDGLPLTEFSYDKALLADTDYTLKVEIITANGLRDYVTKRVVCR